MTNEDDLNPMGDTSLGLVAASRAQNRARANDALRRHFGDKTAAAKELGIARKTLYEWLEVEKKEETRETQRELEHPASGKAKITLTRIKRQLEFVVDGIVVDIPEKAKKATLMDSVNALVKLVPLMKDINSLLIPRKHIEDMNKTLVDRAKRG